jgi:hypothetical protein
MKKNIASKILLSATLISLLFSILITFIYEEPIVELDLYKKSRIFLEAERYSIFTVNNEKPDIYNVHYRNDTIFLKTVENDIIVGPTLTMRIYDKSYNYMGSVKPLREATYYIDSANFDESNLKIGFQKEADGKFHFKAFIIFYSITLAFTISLLLFHFIRIL